ncbi:histidinol-phosphate aminotransferase [Kushneria sinocarnis]|uniref:Histidinol-phosphate aminotransferase n=1 Tax=Kushneria sinocarnis TaxID=595502 RepID=A0A420WT02_9GAMM|nr:histidinol-phosphate transaminase [Kushneria sinocarnis]RKQ95744.1 histidinol-phosphate aminotransferase [Kushneria sinocarnis]
MSQFWSPGVHRLTPYTPGEQPRQKLIKLNTNENPWPPAPGVERVLRHFESEQLRRYPDPEATALREALAREYSVDVSQVFVGNGSDEVLALAFQAFFLHDAPLLMPEISYSFYPVYCRLYGIGPRTIPLNEQWQVDLEGFEGEHAGIVFANPNAPTGHGHERADIRRLLERMRERVVLIDEAYADFGGESAVPLIEEHPNLLVTGTFSKSRSLAGLRIGFAIGSRELIEGLDRVKDSFNSYPLDMLAIEAGVAALADRDHFEHCRRAVMATRDHTRQALEAMGFEVLPSQTNFLLVRATRQPAAEIFAALREEYGILVRHFNTDQLRDFLRISIGSEDEMQALIEALGEIGAG